MKFVKWEPKLGPGQLPHPLKPHQAHLFDRAGSVAEVDCMTVRSFLIDLFCVYAVYFNFFIRNHHN